MSSQPEYILEQKLVDQLQQLGHKKVKICNENDLIINLKIQLEIHNKKTFSDKELEMFLRKQKFFEISFILSKMTEVRNGLSLSVRITGARISFR